MITQSKESLCMAKINRLEESILRKIPGIFVLKEVKDKSYYTFTNENSAKMMGFKNSDAMIGFSDEDIKCGEVAKNWQLFYQHDKEVMSGKTIRTLDVYPYLVKDVIGILAIKQPLRDNNENICGVICNGISLKKNDINSFFLRIWELVPTEKKFRRCFGSTYEIKDKIEKFDLSKRELECLFYLIRGKSARQIANILFRSVRTIENHIQNIKLKCQITKKSEIFDFAYAHGLLNIIPDRLIPGTAIFNNTIDR